MFSSEQRTKRTPDDMGCNETAKEREPSLRTTELVEKVNLTVKRRGHENKNNATEEWRTLVVKERQRGQPENRSSRATEQSTFSNAVSHSKIGRPRNWKFPSGDPVSKRYLAIGRGQ